MWKKHDYYLKLLFFFQLENGCLLRATNAAYIRTCLMPNGNGVATSDTPVSCPEGFPALQDAPKSGFFLWKNEARREGTNGKTWKSYGCDYIIIFMKSLRRTERRAKYVMDSICLDVSSMWGITPNLLRELGLHKSPKDRCVEERQTQKKKLCLSVPLGVTVCAHWQFGFHSLGKLCSLKSLHFFQLADSPEHQPDWNLDLRPNPITCDLCVHN